MQLSEHAAVQRSLWGTDAEGWATYAEGHNRPLFEALLDATGVGPGSRVLDVGCGTGMTLVMAAERGAEVSGIDVSPELLAVARDRLPDADLREGDMQSLPFADNDFDAVLGVNSFQFAADPVGALAEAARVVQPGGRVGASLFAAPERNQSTALHEAMGTLIPPEKDGDHAPYALSAPGNLEAALAGAGLTVEADGEVPLVWAYATEDDAVRGLTSSAGGARAIQAAGLPAVEAVIRAALQPFRDVSGEITMHNVFRWVVARR